MAEVEQPIWASLTARRTTLLATLLLGTIACLSAAQEAENPDPRPAASEQRDDAPDDEQIDEKQIIGATAKVVVTSADVSFNARVDTGAQSTSMHVEEIEVEGAAEDKRKNWGKKIKFRIKNRKGATAWVESVVDRTVIVKTSEQNDRRYKVPLQLKWQNLEKTVLVTLNDRSGMNYPVLLGRDFLRGDLLVDVELDDENENEEVADEVADADTGSEGK